MITQQELTDQCTPEIIKKMCELAEGFECNEFELNTIFQIRYNSVALPYMNVLMFPLLLHRAVVGWNKQSGADSIVIYGDRIESCIKFNLTEYMSDNYQPATLTHAECAMLDCLLEVLK